MSSLPSIDSLPLAFWSPGPAEMMVLAVVALLLYGGNLPEVARSWGKSFAEFRRGLSGIQNELSDVIYSKPEQIPYHDNKYSENKYSENQYRDDASVDQGYVDSNYDDSNCSDSNDGDVNYGDVNDGDSNDGADYQNSNLEESDSEYQAPDGAETVEGATTGVEAVETSTGQGDAQADGGSAAIDGEPPEEKRLDS